jgi:hypothetical protein
MTITGAKGSDDDTERAIEAANKVAEAFSNLFEVVVTTRVPGRRNKR